ncbi:unnamed protein product [Gadus morhua 'NCC']
MRMSVLGVLWGVSAVFFSNLLRGGPWQVLVIAATALVGVASAWVGRLLLRHAWFRHRLSCFSRPPAHSWLIGHLGQMRDSEEGLLDVDRLVRTHGHSCSWFLGPFTTWAGLPPDFTTSITVKAELFYGFLRPWLGQSLLLSNGEEWSRRRRLLTPAFHFDVLKGYVAVVHNATHTMHSKWIRLSSEGQRDLEMFQHVGLMTLDSLLRCAFSHSSDCQETPHEFTTAILELGDLIMDRRPKDPPSLGLDLLAQRPGQALPEGHRGGAQIDPPIPNKLPWYTASCPWSVCSFTRRVVEHRRTLIREQSHRESPEGTARDGTAGDTAQRQKRKDFIDIILLAQDEEGGGLTDKEVEAETNTFMFAGHDTTASAICWTLFNLAGHAHYQDRCRDEVKELMRDRAEQDIKWADLSSMPFTTMCIKESLRLHSPVLAVTRQYTRDVDLPGNRTVPKGTAVQTPDQLLP